MNAPLLLRRFTAFFALSHPLSHRRCQPSLLHSFTVLLLLVHRLNEGNSLHK
jgi:hypothetical protein